LKLLELLISSRWLLGVADARGVRASEPRDRARLHQIIARPYRTAAALANTSRRSPSPGADVLVRRELRLPERAIAHQLTGGNGGAYASSLVSGFQP
jgi:hypothetical protein